MAIDKTPLNQSKTALDALENLNDRSLSQNSSKSSGRN